MVAALSTAILLAVLASPPSTPERPYFDFSLCPVTLRHSVTFGNVQRVYWPIQPTCRAASSVWPSKKTLRVGLEPTGISLSGCRATTSRNEIKEGIGCGFSTALAERKTVLVDSSWSLMPPSLRSIKKEPVITGGPSELPCSGDSTAPAEFKSSFGGSGATGSTARLPAQDVGSSPTSGHEGRQR